MFIPLEVILCANPQILSIIKIMIVLIGLISIFLTFTFYKCKWLRVVFICLGVSGLISLLLFMLNGSFCAFGLFGSIGLVLTLHCLVLKQVKNDLNEEYKPIYPPKPCNVEKKSCFNETVKSNEVKFVESSVKTPCGNKYNKYYHKKSYYKKKCEKKCCCKKCETKSSCKRDSKIFDEMFLN